MAKLHKSFVGNWKKEEEIIQEGVGEGMEQEARKGEVKAERGSILESNPGILMFTLKLSVTTLCTL